MTTTSSPPHSQAPARPPSPGRSPHRPAKPATGAGRRERRPGLAALAIALMALSALGVTYLLAQAGNTSAVLALSKTVARGEVIDRGHLKTVHVSTDPALHPVPADQIASIVGKRAATDLPAGSLLTTGAATDHLVPRSGRTLVGLQLKPSQLPASPLQPGDKVRLVILPAEQGATGRGAPAAEPVPATVVTTTPGPDNQTTRVDVEVPQGGAASLSTSAAAGRVSLVLDSRER